MTPEERELFERVLRAMSAGYGGGELLDGRLRWREEHADCRCSSCEDLAGRRRRNREILGLDRPAAVLELAAAVVAAADRRWLWAQRRDRVLGGLARLLAALGLA